jgi:hypothetical protein
VHGDEGYGYSLQYSWHRYLRRGPVYTLSSFLYFFQNRASPVAFFAFGSTFFGYALDVSKSMYQIRAPNSERPKMTMNSVITGRPSAWTERSAVGVRIGASHSKAMVNVVGCLVAFEAEKGALSAGKPRNGLYFWKDLRLRERKDSRLPQVERMKVDAVEARETKETDANVSVGGRCTGVGRYFSEAVF